jgi:tape measure domain-containing protein
MSSLSVPITGDLSGFTSAISELKAEIRALSGSIRSALAPVRQEAAAAASGINAVGTGARSASGNLRGMVGKLSSAGAAAANIVAGATAAKTALRAMAGINPASLARGLATAKGALRGLGVGLRAILSNKTFRVLAIGAIGAAAAIGTIVVAVKIARAAFRVFKGGVLAVFSGIRSGIRGVSSMLGGLGGKLRSLVPGGGGGMLGPLVGIAGAAAGIAVVTSQLKGAFAAASAFEDLEVSVSSFLGSTKAAKDLLAELSEFADKTPFATRDIQEAASSLLGAGVRGNVAGITKEIAAVAKNGTQLKELADALGKGFAKGKFQTEELNKFLERGINLMPALEQATGLTGDALRKAIEDGLGFDTVTEALRSMSAQGGMFFGLLERRSKTASGLISTLGSVWETVRRTFAQPIVDAIKPMITRAISLVESWKDAAARAGKAVGGAILAGFALIKSGRSLELLKVGLRLAFMQAGDILMRTLRAAVAFLATALPKIFAGATETIKEPAFWYGLKLIFRGLGKALGAEIRDSLPLADGEKIASQRRSSDQLLKLGNANIGLAAGGQKSASEILGGALVDAGKAAKEAFGGEATEGLKDARKAMAELVGTVKADIAALRKEAAVPPPAEGATGDSNAARLDGGEVAGKSGQSFGLTTSLGRVGGGGFGISFPSLISETKRGNGILEKIAHNTSRAKGAAPVLA